MYVLNSAKESTVPSGKSGEVVRARSMFSSKYSWNPDEDSHLMIRYCLHSPSKGEEEGEEEEGETLDAFL
jgi:hypothetical protein